jgi:hypothetical protein
MVDELMRWGVWRFGDSCHLTCNDLEKLHAFAASIGLRRAWFQEHVRPELCHYDLTANKRRQALAAGAIFVPAMTQARARKIHGR